MNQLFTEHIGMFMFVCFDNIIIDSIEEHVEHIPPVFKIVNCKKSPPESKENAIFAHELAILGHIIDSKGMKLDLNKVDSIGKWKMPTKKDQLASYFGALGYLTLNCPGICILMVVLTTLVSGMAPF